MNWNWETIRSLFYRYWNYLLFGMVTLILVTVSYYYIEAQFEQRERRLDSVHIYEVKKRGELSPEFAPVDSTINEMLFPHPEVYLPLHDQLPVKEEWGPYIRTWNLRVNQPPLQPSPDLLGPS